MSAIKVQLILYWVAVGFCFLGTFFFVASLTFKKEQWLRFGVIFSFLASLPLTAGIIARWIETGHFPYWGPYEVFTSFAWGALLFYLVVQLFKPNLKIAGTVVAPAVLLMTGIGVMELHRNG